jgi:hypothetical protein
MSVTTIFDTLAYAKKLKAAGFTEDQAEIQAQALVEIIEERLYLERSQMTLFRRP